MEILVNTKKVVILHPKTWFGTLPQEELSIKRESGENPGQTRCCVSR